ncbi:MAG: precorrin-6Y C5,15-methyltransferase (decarboxylating) subunit CbiT [Chloroflexales bacterium]
MDAPISPRDRRGMRTGFTTGTNAAAAAKAATLALLTEIWPETVTVCLPTGETTIMTPVACRLAAESAQCCMIKDGGDDPDVTHGALLSVHGRPLAEVVRAACAATKAAILTDDLHTPARIAQTLMDAGVSANRPCAICENLGDPEQRIVRTHLADAAGQVFAALNVFVVWPEGGIADIRYPISDSEKPTSDDPSAIGYQLSAIPPSAIGYRLSAIPPSAIGYRLSAHPPGIPDADFSTTGGLLTRREIRLLSLAELAIQPGEVCWDLGAGSGAVSIEAARGQPMATVYAVERRGLMCDHIRENMRRFPVPNLHLVEGTAPAVCADLPNPHAVFIGGSGGHLAEMITLVRQRLHPGGCLVLALVTLENLQAARDCLPDARVAQVQVSVGAPILGMLRLEAHNPVFVVSWRS